VPGRDVREGNGVDLGSSPRRGDDWGCGVDDVESPRIGEGVETGLLGALVLPAPTDAYLDFAFGLDGSTHNDFERASGPLVVTGLYCPSVSETLRNLESAMGPPVGAGTNVDVDLAPMDVDAMLSASVPQRLLSGGGETQCRGSLSSSSLSLLPFHLSTSSPQGLGHSPSSSPVVTVGRNLALTCSDSSLSPKTPVEVRPQTHRISVTVAGSGFAPGSVEPASAASALFNLGSTEKVFAGPSLFLDDDGME